MILFIDNKWFKLKESEFYQWYKTCQIIIVDGYKCVGCVNQDIREGPNGVLTRSYFNIIKLALDIF